MKILTPRQRGRLLSPLERIFGSERLRDFRLRRNYRHYNRTGIVFIHIPKAAGSSISYSLYGQSLGHFTAQELMSFRPTDFTARYSFSVIRHPIQRLRSSYNYICSNGTEFGSIAPNKDYLADDFRTFELFVKSWLPRQDLDVLDPVLRPQARFVCDEGGNLLVKEIFKLESLTDHWSAILSRGRPYQKTLGRYNVNANIYRETLKEDPDVVRLIGKRYEQDVNIWKSAI